MVADRTLVQGAAMAAPKFVDVAGAFSKNFESTLGEITKATNEANAKRSELINSLDFIQFDENGNTIPMSESQLAIAKDIREQVLADINTGDPFSSSKADSIGKAKLKVQEVANLANVHKQVIADMQSAKSELSGANNTEAIEKLNAIKNAKLVKDPNTGEYKYEVAGELKSAQELAAYPEDIIEIPAVAEAKIGSTFNALSKKYTTIDKNDPSKRAQFFGNAEQEVRTAVIQQLNDPAYGNDLRYHALSQGSDYIKNPPLDGLTKKQIDTFIELELGAAGKITKDTDPLKKANLIKNRLNEMVEEAYVNGFKENNPDSKIEVTPPQKEPTEGAIKRALDKKDKKIFGDALIENALRISGGSDNAKLERFMNKEGNLVKDQIEAYGRAANIPNTIITKAPPIFRTEQDEDGNEIQVQINPNEYIVANDRTGKQVPFDATYSISPADIEGFAMTAYGFNATEVAEYKRRRAAHLNKTKAAKARAEARRKGTLSDLP